MRKIETEKAPKAVGPYSQAIRVDAPFSLLFVSGQLPIDPATGNLITHDIRKATHQVLDNIEAILKAGGSDFSQVVRVEIFLTDLNDFHAVNEEYKIRFIHAHLPARQTVQVSKLPMNSAIEISCIAAIN